MLNVAGKRWQDNQGCFSLNFIHHIVLRPWFPQNSTSTLKTTSPPKTQEASGINSDGRRNQEIAQTTARITGFCSRNTLHRTGVSTLSSVSVYTVEALSDPEPTSSSPNSRCARPRSLLTEEANVPYPWDLWAPKPHVLDV